MKISLLCQNRCLKQAVGFVNVSLWILLSFLVPYCPPGRLTSSPRFITFTMWHSPQHSSGTHMQHMLIPKLSPVPSRQNWLLKYHKCHNLMHTFQTSVIKDFTSQGDLFPKHLSVFLHKKSLRSKSRYCSQWVCVCVSRAQWGAGAVRGWKHMLVRDAEISVTAAYFPHYPQIHRHMVNSVL